MVATKRGRKKLFSNVPSNFDFWCLVLKNPDETQDFINRGNENQHNSMIRTLNYLRKYEKELFNQINGVAILKELKSE